MAKEEHAVENEKPPKPPVATLQPVPDPAQPAVNEYVARRLAAEKAGRPS